MPAKRPLTRRYSHRRPLTRLATLDRKIKDGSRTLPTNIYYDHNGSVTDAGSNLKTTTYANGASVGYACDELDRLSKKVYTDSGYVTYIYNAERQLAKLTHGNSSGNPTNYGNSRGNYSNRRRDKGRQLSAIMVRVSGISYGAGHEEYKLTVSYRVGVYIMLDLHMEELISSESAAFAKHILCFLFFTVFYLRWLPRKKHGGSSFRAELEQHRAAVILDIICGVVFFALLILSLVLLLRHGVVFAEDGLKTVTQHGKVTGQWLRPYLLSPTSAGSYAIVEGKTFYLPTVKASLLNADVYLTYLLDNNYVIGLHCDVVSDITLTLPWYLSVGRWAMLISGGYLASRLGAVACRECFQAKKQRDKSDPLSQFMDHL